MACSASLNNLELLLNITDIGMRVPCTKSSDTTVQTFVSVCLATPNTLLISFSSLVLVEFSRVLFTILSSE